MLTHSAMAEEKKSRRYVGVHVQRNRNPAGPEETWFADVPRVGDHIGLGQEGYGRVVLVIWTRDPDVRDYDAEIWVVPADLQEMHNAHRVD
jgi:hypothetical protein